MKISKIIEAIESCENKQVKVYFVSERGDAVVPSITQNNIVKSIINIDNYDEKKGYLIPKISLEEFYNHLKKNCNGNSLLVFEGPHDDYFVESVQNMEDPEDLYFQLAIL